MKRITILLATLLIALSCSQSNVIVKSDFEDGTIGSWTGRGSAALAATNEAAHAGKYGILVTKRTQSWNGPTIDLTGKVLPTGTYGFSVWAKIKDGQPDADLTVTLQREKSGTQNWDRVASVDATSGKWVNLTGNYEAKEQFDKASVYVESANVTLEYCIDDVSILTIKNPKVAEKINLANIASLAKLYKKNFVIGTAVELNQLEGAEGALIRKQFSGLTPENIMKPQYMEPTEGNFVFSNADKIVDYAAKNKMALHGHTLVWHSQNAKWMYYNDKGNFVSKEVLLKRLENYITTIVSRYKGKIQAWDVVNEVVDGSGLRNSEWYQIAGEEYIEKAFIWAHQADPKAKLIINEYDTTDPVKGDTLINLVKSLKGKGIPVDGIGMQFHISVDYPSIQSISDSLKKFDALGLELYITELDMSLNADPNLVADKAPEDKLIRQGHRYREIFDVFKSIKNIVNVTFWGFQDGHTWLTFSPVVKPDWPLLFDAQLNPKYAYWGLADPTTLPADVQLAVSRNDFTATASKGTPVIDGKEDAIWKNAQEMNINIYIQGKGAHGVGKALYDAKNLYVYVKVTDPVLSKKSINPYEQDTVEIFVDEKNDKATEYKDDDAQYRINFDNGYSDKGAVAKITSKTAKTAAGYDVEVKIPLQKIQGVEGTKIGFDLQINDDPGTGVRDSYSKWNDPTNESFRNTSGFGTLVFGK
jgi:endo-1,4-beta-xylanase